MPVVRLALRVVLLATAALPAHAEDAPAGDIGLMPGIYQCFAEGQYFFLSLGGDQAYRQTDPPLDPGGLYEVNAATGLVRFTTGPYAIGLWTAEVHNTAERHGVILHADQDYDCRAAR